MAPTENELANRTFVEHYFAMLNAGEGERAIEECFAPDIRQEEYPNRLLPQGAHRDLAGLREAAARGRGLIKEQHFELRHVYATGDTVVVESVWTGTVGVDAGPFSAGTILRAHFAQIFELLLGRIVAIRNYDCFDPW